MSAEVKVLIQGYAKQVGKGWKASSTVTLIKSGNKKIIFDPGCNREKLVLALKKEKLKSSEIDFVVLSHGHIDHSGLTGVFENADIITFENLMYKKDNQLEFNPRIMGKDTCVIETPGHTSEHISLIVKTKKGTCIIAGDVFWWVDGEKQIIDINKMDDSHPKELNMKQLIKSRKLVLQKADYVIPGHGLMFQVKKH